LVQRGLASGETPPANPDDLRKSFFTKRKKDAIGFEFGGGGKDRKRGMTRLRAKGAKEFFMKKSICTFLGLDMVLCLFNGCYTINKKLISAAGHGRLGAVQELVQEGADINYRYYSCEVISFANA
jgi:hypothetical protein